MRGLCIVPAGIGAFLGAFFGGWDGFLYVLIALVVTDYVTGVMSAAASGELSSAVGFRGIFKKLCIFILVGASNIIDVHIIGAGEVLRTTAIMFYIANEGISLLENAASLGLPVPRRLTDMLKQLKSKEDE
ncbi:holin [Clostridia bacterium]|nr:holin [Clostridia bacterium]